MEHWTLSNIVDPRAVLISVKPQVYNFCFTTTKVDKDQDVFSCFELLKMTLMASMGVKYALRTLA